MKRCMRKTYAESLTDPQSALHWSYNERQRQAIIWFNVGMVLIGPLGTNFSEISIEIHPFSITKMHLKISSIAAILSRPQCVKLTLGHG